LILLLGFLAYSNTFDSGFHFDDGFHIKVKEGIRDLDNYASAQMWANVNQRPLSTFTLALNYKYGKLDVFGYHLFNLCIHLLSALLVYLLCISILKSPGMSGQGFAKRAKSIAFFCALIFVLHPLQTQSVTYIIQRMTSLSGMFFLLSAFFYLKGRIGFVEKHKKFSWLLISLAFLSGIAAVLSKQNAVTFPIIWLLIEVFFVRDKEGKPFKKIQFIGLSLMLAAILAVIVFQLLPKETEDIGRYEYLITQFRVIPKYIQLALLPISQNLDYDFSVSESIWAWKELLGLAIILGLFYLAFSSYKKNRLVSFGILWFFITLLVESSIIPIRDVIFEHRLYIPILGIILAFVSVLYKYLPKGKIIKPAYILIIVSLALAIKTYSRNKIWKSNFSLWEDTHKKSPNKSRVNLSFGNANLELLNYNLAIQYFSRAIALNPENREAYFNRANVYVHLEEYKKAIQDFDIFINAHPELAEPYNFLGKTKLLMNDLGGAVVALNQAISLKPGLFDAWFNRGNARSLIRDYQGAIDDYTESVSLGNQEAAVFNNRGQAYLHIKEMDKAFSDFSTAVYVDPNYAKAYQNRANILYQQGRVEEALQDFKQVILLEPQNKSAYFGRGLVYLKKNKLKLALSDLLIAKKLGMDISPELLEPIQQKLDQTKNQQN
jgi:protein O-mannosyl-transferase